MAAIAIEAGFAGQGHFNRQVKRAFGTTPGRWAGFARNDAPRAA